MIDKFRSGLLRIYWTKYNHDTDIYVDHVGGYALLVKVPVDNILFLRENSAAIKNHN